MNPTIIVAIIGFAGVVISSVITGIATYSSATKKYADDLKVQIAVINNQVVTLSKAIDEFKEMSRRIPAIEEQIKSIFHRLKRLEGESNEKG